MTNLLVSLLDKAGVEVDSSATAPGGQLDTLAGM